MQSTARLVGVTIGLVICATAHAGYQPGTQPRTTPPAQLQAGDNVLPPSLQLERANYCQSCHTFGTPSTASTSPGAIWQGSMMANAARDPLMFAALAIANQDVPGIGGDYCLRCHSPAGFTAGHTTMNPGNAPNNYPCHSYVIDSPDQCRCLDGSCTQRDECKETPGRVANGYCIVAFDDRVDPAFKGHPAVPTKSFDEPYTQTPTQDNTGDLLDPFDDTEGLSCAFCHRMDPAKNATRLYGGNYALSNLTTQRSGWLTPRSVRFGPYANEYTGCTSSLTTTPDVDCNQATPHGHDVQQSALHQSSDLCGTCHDVTNPTLNRLSPTGQDLGFKMPIERTYSEWKASSRGDPASGLFETCQGCHMPKPTQPGGVCTSVDNFPYSRNRTGVEDAHQHEFAGGNAWLPSVFANVIAPQTTDMGVVGDPQWFFDLITGANRQTAYLYTAQAAESMLSRAASLLVTNPPAMAKSGDTIPINVHIENNTGHKLPTGYPEGRRMWIQVFASVAGQTFPTGSETFFASGAYDDATGVLTRDAQIKVYEVELSTAGKSAPPNPPEFHFATNQIVWKDNRIPPAGFDPNAPSFAEMAPVGYTYPLFNGKLQNWDDTGYSIPIPANAQGDVQVTVKLVYQTASKDYIDFLRGANTTNGRGQDMTRIWENHGRGKYVEMASTTFTVRNTAPCTPVAEVCDGKDNDCNGTIDDGDVCADMATPDLSATDDMGVTGDDQGATSDDQGTGELPDMAAKPKPTGCGVSVAGNDWRDLGPLAVLFVGALLVVRRRRRA